MSFIPDCSRSAKRLSQGKALLAQAKELGLPGKTTIRNGFRIKAWQMDGLEKITINAPAGMVVLASNEGKVKSSCSDYWQDTLSPARECSIVKRTDPSGVEPLIEYPYKVFVGDTAVENELASPTVWTDRSRCMPAMMPFYDSEGVVTALSYMRDVEHPQGTYPLYNRMEIRLDSYGGVGTGAYRIGVSHGADFSGWQAYTWTMQFVKYQQGCRVVEFCGNDGFIYDTMEEEGVVYYVPVLAYITTIPTPQAITLDSVSVIPAWASLPADLYAILRTSAGIIANEINASSLGTYAYTDPMTGRLTILAATMNYATSGVCSFYANAANRIWQVFYTIYTEGFAATDTEPEILPTVVIVNSDNIVPALSAIYGIPLVDITADVGPELTFVVQALERLLPLPNVRYGYECPHDSVMFHGPDGIYTWTRNDGCVRFGTDGLAQVTMTVPVEVTEEVGVRPVITYGSTVADVDYYLCVCDKVTVKVKAVYVGSPFTGWTALSMPTGDLLHVRPMEVNGSLVMLAGIVQITTDGIVKTHAAVLRAKDGWIGEWTILAEISGVATGAGWDAILYGNDIIVEKLRQYPSPPAAIPQPWFKPDYQAVPLP